MKLLLDTNILIRWLQGRLPERVRTLLESDSNQRFVSSAVLWEVALKERLTKAGITVELIEQLTEQLSAAWLPIRHQHVRSLVKLPPHHSDPFDRIMLAQACYEDMVLVSMDSIFKQYKTVNTLS